MGLLRRRRVLLSFFGRFPADAQVEHSRSLSTWGLVGTASAYTYTSLQEKVNS